MPSGRWLLNDKMLERAKKIAGVGAPAKRIAEYLGIDLPTFYRYKRAGKELFETTKKSERTRHEQRLVDFYRIVSFCRIEHYRENLQIVHNAARDKESVGTWQAAAWWLERTYHEEFGKKVPFDADQVEKWLRTNYGENIAEQVITLLEQKDAEPEMEADTRTPEVTNETTDSKGESPLEERVSAPPGSSLEPPGEIPS